MAAVGITNAPPVELADAFRRAYGKYSFKPVRELLSQSAGDLASLRRSFLTAMAYSLPEVREGRIQPVDAGVPPELRTSKIWNVFHGNPHACGFAATLLWLHESNVHENIGTRRLMEQSVAHYLATISTASYEVAAEYQQLGIAVGSRPVDDELAEAPPVADAFGKFVAKFDSILRSPAVAELALGIATILEAVMIVREKREEEAALTLDIGIPLSASWPLALDMANKQKDSRLGKAALVGKQTLLRSLPQKSMEELTRQLEDAGKVVGRGVSELELRHFEEPGKDYIKSKAIWRSHENAPLSRLYGLNWRLPDERDDPDVRIVMLGNGTVSIFAQGDPLFEYLLGYWSYVDLAGKCGTLAELIGHETADVEDVKPTLYRVARFAHQLAYHNHGSNIEVVFGQPSTGAEHMADIKDRWDVDEIGALGLSLPKTLPRDAVPDVQSPTNGRLAYVLALNDGLSTWSLSEDAAEIKVFEYNQYLSVSDLEIKPHWDVCGPEMGMTDKFSKGGRHRAAFMRSLWLNGPKRLVFCVSQDGYIEVFADGRILRVR